MYTVGVSAISKYTLIAGNVNFSNHGNMKKKVAIATL